MMIAQLECPLWVKSRHSGDRYGCPLYPQKRTFYDAPKWTSLESSLCTARFRPAPLPERQRQRDHHDDYRRDHDVNDGYVGI